MQPIGDAAHADAPDADEMNRPDGEWEGPHAAISLSDVCKAGWPEWAPICEITRSAKLSAAAGRPCCRAASAARASVSGCAARPAIRSASSFGVKMRWLTIQAPPLWAKASALLVWWSSVAKG